RRVPGHGHRARDLQEDRRAPRRAGLGGGGTGPGQHVPVHLAERAARGTRRVPGRAARREGETLAAGGAMNLMDNGQPSALPSRVLVVDDDPGFRRLCTMMLAEAKIEHVAVGSAKEALRTLDAARDEPFDVILLDMELPGMKGWELLKYLR